MRPTTYDEVPEDLIRHCEHVVGEVFQGQENQHLVRTPERFARYLTHLGREDVYNRWTAFENTDKVQQLITVPGIHFWGACTHHLLPFVGTIDLGYVPMNKLIGLSKIPLLVRAIAKGFWMQEDLTKAIANRFTELVAPYGVAVRVRAQHTCQLLDVGPPIPWMVTTELHGVLLHNPSAKQEFMEACRAAAQ